jgi:hypothetical protein
VEQLSRLFHSLSWLRQQNNEDNGSTLSPSAIMKVRKSNEASSGRCLSDFMSLPTPDVGFHALAGAARLTQQMSAIAHNSKVASIHF